MMNITVFGGSGFVGSHLVSRLLEAGHRVSIFDKAPSPVHSGLVSLGDVRDADAVSRILAHCDCIINLAAEHGDNVKPASRYFEVNVGGAQNIVRAAVAHGIRRVVFLSTVAIYGLDQPPADESAAFRPFDDYGRTKAEAETVFADWAATDAARSLTILRPAVIFGEGNRGNVFNLIEQIRLGRFLMIGQGNNRKSIAYVGNVADFLCSRLDAEPGMQIFNYADKPDLTIRELVQEIRALLPGARISDFTLPYGMAMTAGYCFDMLARISGRRFAASSARVRKFCADTQVAIDALERTGFRPRFSIRDGLERMIGGMITENRTLVPCRERDRKR